MSYVLVPVPEEHVEAVTQYARWGVSRSPAGAWDQAAIAELLRDFDEQARGLVVSAAEAVLDEGPLTVGAAARVTDCSVLEVLGLQLEINTAVRRAQGPPFVLVIDVPDRVDGPAPSADTWQLCMADDVARFLLAADSDELRGG